MTSPKFRWLISLIVTLLVFSFSALCILDISAKGLDAVVVQSAGVDGGNTPAGLLADEWIDIVREIGPEFEQEAYLKAGDINEDDQFGYSVAIDGNTLVIGVPYMNYIYSNSGAAYVFVRNGASWTQQGYLVAENAGETDMFGFSVAISGDTIVVGAPSEDGDGTDPSNNDAGDAGAAYVYERSGSVWSQEAYLKASNVGANDIFGYSVAISDDTLVVGALDEDSGDRDHPEDNTKPGSGAAYVFVSGAGGWTQQAYLKADNVGDDDQFGYSVSISADLVVVGALYEDSDGSSPDDDSGSDTGAAYVFTRNETTWSQEAYLKADNVGDDDQFGYSVSISGDTLVVGAPNEDSDGSSPDNDDVGESGAAYVFERNGTSWTQDAFLKADTVVFMNYFGNSVGISGDTVAVGAYSDHSDGSSPDNFDAVASGAVHVFQKTNGAWTDATWLKASNVETKDMFGCAVSISGNTLAVGAYGEDSSGEQSNNDTSSAGAAYVFRSVNYQPTADAGSDQVVDVLTLVNLDGSASDDPEGDTPLTYQWTQTDGTLVSLTGANTATPSFTAPGSPGKLTFSLVVTDSLGLASDPDTVTVEIQGQSLFLPVILR